MTKTELYKLSKQIDELDTLVGLNEMTITDVRIKIDKALRVAPD